MTLSHDFISFKIGLWLSLPFVVFGPYVVWSSVPYQESTLLLFLMGGLLLSSN